MYSFLNTQLRMGELSRIVGFTTTEERTINFEVRYCAELADLDSTHYRVAFHGDAYEDENESGSEEPESED